MSLKLNQKMNRLCQGIDLCLQHNINMDQIFIQHCGVKDRGGRINPNIDIIYVNVNI